MIVKWCCETGFAGCDIEDEIEMDDDATDEQIDEEVREAMFNHISYCWWRKGNEDDG